MWEHVWSCKIKKTTEHVMCGVVLVYTIYTIGFLHHSRAVDKNIPVGDLKHSCHKLMWDASPRGNKNGHPAVPWVVCRKNFIQYTRN
jgi:hypothetical protein